jgi:hypothetical protein
VNQTKESIIYFPIDPSVTFKSAETSVSLASMNDHKYTLMWKISSNLDRKAYLRQDVGLLFSNGRLAGKQGSWKQNIDHLAQEKQVSSEGNARFDAVTFHYAELHEKADVIRSSQTMTADSLYAFKAPDGMLQSFRIASNSEQRKWQEELDRRTERMLEYSWQKGIGSFAINPDEYHSYPLTALRFFSQHSFPGYTKKETDRIIGNLWEGLYKNYFLGIKKADGTTVKPFGSTMPLIMIAKDKTHLLVLTETKNGEPILLRQMIGTAN